MLEPIEDLPDGVIGFEAVGEVHAADYADVLIPAIDRAARDGKVRLVYVLGDRFDGYSAGAAWEDAKLGFEHMRSMARMALVSDLGWVQHLASMFGWMVPGDFRRFPRSDLPQAKAWAAG